MNLGRVCQSPIKIDEVSYNQITQEKYDNYLRNAEEIKNTATAKLETAKNTNIKIFESQKNQLVKFKNVLVPFNNKLTLCEDIDEEEVRQKFNEIGILKLKTGEQIVILLFQTNNEEEMVQKIREFKMLKSATSPIP